MAGGYIYIYIFFFFFFIFIFLGGCDLADLIWVNFFFWTGKLVLNKNIPTTSFRLFVQLPFLYFYSFGGGRVSLFKDLFFRMGSR